MSGGSYDYLYCKDCDELFAYSNIRTLEEMESRFLDLGYEDVAKDFRRLIEYIKSANNRVEVLGGQLNEMMHDIEWYDSGDIGADTLAERVEKYRRADTPQTDLVQDSPNLVKDLVKDLVEDYEPYEYEIKAWHKEHQEPYCEIADTPQMECRTCKWAEVSWTSHYCDDCKAHNKYEPNDTPQTDCETCKHYKLACELFSEVCKYEPTTQTETENSNLTFEKVMEEIQTQVIEFPDTHQKFTFARKIEMDGDSIKIGGWEYKGVKDAERFVKGSEQTDCGWGKPTTVSHREDKED